MAFFDIFRRKPVPSPSAASTLANPEGWFVNWANGGIPLFGESVSEETAMSVAAVYRSASLIAGVIASLDLGVFYADEELGQVPVPGKLQRLLSVCPFPGRQLTAYSWKETMVLNLLLAGNAFSIIRYDQAARLTAFEYVRPNQVKIAQRNQRNIYTVSYPDGRADEVVDQDAMIHVLGPSLDGIYGMSRVRVARNSISMARSIEEVQGRALENAMSPKSVIKMPPGMMPDDAKRLQAFVTNEFTGKSHTGKTLFLDAGSEFDALSISMVDLALLDARKASISEVAMWFGLPPSLLGMSEANSWGTGLISQVVSFLKFSLNPDLERFENEFRNKCTTGHQFILFDRDQLLQMDPITSADVAAKEVASGIATINEIRKKRNRPVVEGGDVAMTNSTNISLAQAIQPRAVGPQPPPAAPEPDAANQEPQP